MKLKKKDDDEEKMAFLVKGPSIYVLRQHIFGFFLAHPPTMSAQHKYITGCQKTLPFSEPTPESFC